MAIYLGAAFANPPAGALGGTRKCSIALTTSQAPATPTDHGTFEIDATTGVINFIFSMAPLGTDPPAAPNSVIVTLFDSTTATVVDTVTIASPADGATFAMHATTTSGGGGTAVIGCLRVYLNVIKNNSAGGVGDYNVNSDTQSTSGVLRVNPTTLTLVEAGSAGLSPRTWPDTQQITLTASHGLKSSVAARVYNCAMKKSDLTATYKTGATATGTSAIQTLALASTDPSRKVDYDYPQALTAVIAEAVVAVAALAPTSDATFTWIKVPSGSAQFVDAKTLRTAAFNVDPRVSFATLNRTSSPAVVNYGYHTVAGNFTLQNARAEVLTSSLVITDREVTLVSYDATAATQVQKTISNALSPNAGGTYTVASYTHNGSSVLPRDMGAQGDTSAHTTSGQAKTLRASINAGTTSTNPPVVVSGTWVFLSSLLRLDVHPQKTSTLVKDTDPYASPGSAEDINYVIGSDTLKVFSFVGDCNGVAVSFSPVGVTFQLLDPDLVLTGTTQVITSQSSGPNVGWVTTAASFNVTAPSGVYRPRVLVDISATGSNGNYGDSAVSPFGSLTQNINFVSAYTADKSVAISVPDEAPPGIALTIGVEYLNANGSRAVFDSLPTIRVYKLNSDGTQTDDLAATAMAQYSGQNAYNKVWTPSASGTYVIEVRGVFVGSLVAAPPQVISIRPKFDPISLATSGVLVSRM